MEVLDIGIVVLIFIAASGVFLTAFYNDTSLTTDTYNFETNDTFTSSNSGFFTELISSLNNIVIGLSSIPYVSELTTGFIAGLGILLGLIYLRKG